MACVTQPAAVSRVAASAQQQRLGEHDPLELGEVQALVGAVGAGVGVLDAGDQDARLGEGAPGTRR